MLDIKQKLNLPEPNSKTLSFCQLKAAALKSWLDQLPKANLGETSRLLYKALDEINHLKLSTNLRMELMELIRPEAHYASQALSKHFLNQPAVLPKQARQVAKLAHAIQQRLSTGYLLVATAKQQSNFLLGSKKKINLQKSLALHRALSDQGGILLRSQQLYDRVYKGFWLRQHLIYRFAQEHQLSAARHSDPLEDHTEQSSVEDNFKRTLLLGCISANRLRQEEMKVIYRQLRLWSSECHLKEIHQYSNDQLIVALYSDHPPCFGALLKPSKHVSSLCLDTQQLTGKLSRQLKSENTGVLSNTLLQHLIAAWSSFSSRTNTRAASTDKLFVCVGLAPAHFQIANQRNLEQMLHQRRKLQPKQTKNNNRFIDQAARSPGSNNDVWGSIYQGEQDGASNISCSNIDKVIQERQDAELAASQTAAIKINEYPEHLLPMSNVSPGGYCIAWPENLHTHIKTGEILAVRESQHTCPSVAIVRWVKRSEHQPTQLGIELLSPACTAYVGRMIPKVGAPSSYMRVLMLPEIKLINQAATIITPPITFSTDAKLELFNDSDALTIKLNERVAATGSINQFEYSATHKSTRPSNHAERDVDHTQNKDGFDILWKTL
ncbi:hypothetical protein EDC56_3510 [Sinobacterium caligoides]|uniref:Molecular chaperone n=1 Tax=Sinobacterium caligoides TaxID=933926 RepID=A0A3N2DGB2_9GAMM|nr:hypothetical protein [Sinobacterium caligoides]ROR98771.1 hypothetical protein EDC56_3510 [Sinobacterium caligoides]